MYSTMYGVYFDFVEEGASDQNTVSLMKSKL